MASRKEAKQIIIDGRVQLNGKTVFIPGIHIDPESDQVLCDGNPISEVTQKVYIALNKPRGYLTTTKPENNRPIVMDLLKTVKTRVFPVGRLDYDTEGLLFLTNDGKFSYMMTHPKYKVDKVYMVWVSGVPSPHKLNLIRNGVKTKNFLASPAQVSVISQRKGNALLKLTIREGRKRQVKHMCSAIGHPVIRLKRVQIGPIKLGELPVGKFRYMSDVEVRSILNSISKGEDQQ